MAKKKVTTKIKNKPLEKTVPKKKKVTKVSKKAGRGTVKTPVKKAAKKKKVVSGNKKKVSPENTLSKSKSKSKSIRRSNNNAFPIVGIGASAGGLEALEGFFSSMPPESNIAIVVIQHLAPKY